MTTSLGMLSRRKPNEHLNHYHHRHSYPRFAWIRKSLNKKEGDWYVWSRWNYSYYSYRRTPSHSAMRGKGLYGKFFVGRVDGKDQPGGTKENARYFVLDYANDPYAVEALKYYAYKCKEEYPELARDLWLALREAGKVKSGTKTVS